MAMQKAVAIVGAGVQGRRLAYMWSSQGNPVKLFDLKESALKSALEDIKKLKTKMRGSGHRNGEIDVYSGNDLSTAVSDTWLVVENVPETLKSKKTIISQLDKLTNSTTIIASNSSSFTITEILDNLDVKYPNRCVNLHSYWPPETCALEVMGSNYTSPDVISKLMIVTKKHGFTPFHVRKNSNGYIYNRIWAAIKREALLVAAEEVATPAEIDTIYKDVLKTHAGPFEQMDVVGLDTVLAIEEHYAKCRDDLQQEPRKFLSKMISQGKLGVKNGKGFYNY